MARIAKLTKLLSLVIISQAICLAFGLWVHSRFVIASAEWAATKQIWAELTARTRDLVPVLCPLGGRDLVPGTEEFEEARSRVHSIQSPKDSDILITDSQWRIVHAADTARQESAFGWRPGQTVSWRGASTITSSSAEPVRGTLDTAVGPRPALAFPLKDRSGYGLVYRTSRNVEPTATMIVESLPAASAVTFLWIAGLQAVAVYMILRRKQIEHSDAEAKTLDETLRRTQDLLRTRDAVILGLAKLAEFRDPDTGFHLERISLYSTRLASTLRRHPKFRDSITPAFIRLIGASSALHDIGKVGIEDAILLKPGRLTKVERVQMQYHAAIGAECLQRIEQRLGTSNFLETAREIVLYHHERWDGGGYPNGLAGEQIPLPARIVAIADVYDALASKRPYKEPFSHDQCVAIIREEAGKQFDPEIVRVFLEIQTQFHEIAQQFSTTRSMMSQDGEAEADRQADQEEQVLVST